MSFRNRWSSSTSSRIASGRGPHNLRHVAASEDVRIWQTDLSVSDKTYYCAPSMVWLDKVGVRGLCLPHRAGEP